MTPSTGCWLNWSSARASISRSPREIGQRHRVAVLQRLFAGALERERHPGVGRHFVGDEADDRPIRRCAPLAAANQCVAEFLGDPLHMIARAWR